MSLTIKKWSEITVLFLATALVSATLAYLGHKAAMLQRQVIDQRAEIDRYFRYVHERDDEWGPHVRSIPIAPAGRPEP